MVDVLRNVAHYLPPVQRTRLSMTCTDARDTFTTENETRHWRRVALDALGPADPINSTPAEQALQARFGGLWNTNSIMELWCYYWIVSIGQVYLLEEGFDATVTQLFFQLDAVGYFRIIDMMWLFYWTRGDRRQGHGGRGVSFSADKNFRMGKIPASWKKYSWKVKISSNMHVKWPIADKDGFVPCECKCAPLLRGPWDIVHKLMEWAPQCLRVEPSVPMKDRRSESSYAKALMEEPLCDAPWYDSVSERRIRDLALLAEIRHRDVIARLATEQQKGKPGVAPNPGPMLHRLDGRFFADPYTPYGEHQHLSTSYFGMIQLGCKYLGAHCYRDYLDVAYIGGRVFIEFLEWIVALPDDDRDVAFNVHAFDTGNWGAKLSAAAEHGRNAAINTFLCLMERWYMSPVLDKHAIIDKFQDPL